MIKEEYKYIGNELDLFAKAVNWKKYWTRQIIPFLGKTVLDVGAGTGSTLRQCIKSGVSFDSWLCLEPDLGLCKEIEKFASENKLSRIVQVEPRQLKDYSSNFLFDSVLYIDVIEHIENDADELKLAFSYLKPGGHLIILVPAHNFLYSEFDKEIGHYRRYSKKTLKNIIPADSEIFRLKYLDSIGLLASLANKYFLHQKTPNEKQIKFWDSRMLSISKITDKLLFFKTGKSLLLIARKNS